MKEGFEQIVKEIKEIKIQGADNIAKAGISAFLKKPEISSAKKILSARPTEPLLQNSINILLNSKSLRKDSEKIMKYIKESERKISEKGEKLIKKEMNIFTHCHSSSVISILKLAKKKKKDFVVYNTETTPKLQGRRTALELAKAGIKVIHLPDSAIEFAVRKCDLVLVGADAFHKNGVVNKIGTSIICKIAKTHRIPVYSCGISMKYAKKVKIEFRKGKEVWDERSKLIEPVYPAFDFTRKIFITGVVSEFGILNYNDFIKKAKENLKKFNQ